MEQNEENCGIQSRNEVINDDSSRDALAVEDDDDSADSRDALVEDDGDSTVTDSRDAVIVEDDGDGTVTDGRDSVIVQDDGDGTVTDSHDAVMVEDDGDDSDALALIVDDDGDGSHNIVTINDGSSWRCSVSDKFRAYKNVAGLFLSFTLTFGAFIGILSLQSSVNAVQGLGLSSSAALYGTFMIVGCLSPVYVKVVGAKVAMLTGYLGFMVYTAVSYYPTWGSLIPGSVILGVMYGPTWVALYTHSANTAYKYAQALRERPQHVVARFSGIVAMAAQVAVILGNLISSSVVHIVGVTKNGTDTGTCQDIESVNFTKTSPAYYLLISIYAVLDVVAIGIVLLLIDRDSSRRCSGISVPWVWFKDNVLRSITNFVKITVTWRMILLIPMFVSNGLILGFNVGSFTKNYISDCIGVEWVGFAQAAYGLAAAIFAYIAGDGAKHLSQVVFVYMAIVVGLGVFLLMILWPAALSPDYYVLFGMAVALGISQGTINAVAPGIVSVLFPDSKEAAITTFQLSLSLGYVLSFTTALWCTLTTQLLLLTGVYGLMTLTYTLLTLLNYILAHRSRIRSVMSRLRRFRPGRFRRTPADSYELVPVETAV